MMLFHIFIVLCYLFAFEARHFNGGTITWAPTNPYTNSNLVDVTITQSYSWTFPYVQCANSVPISTATFSGANSNLTCVVDCWNDGGYSTKPVNILTDCVSTSSSVGMMQSKKSKNVTLFSTADFYLAYVGTAWRPLNDPPKSGLEWSMVARINLEKRFDGSINTPPVAVVISPQYATVNKTIQIRIPVSDSNIGDDVRCRWARYTSGFRRRRADYGEATMFASNYDSYKQIHAVYEVNRGRYKRACPGGGGSGGSCQTTCGLGCDCSCSACLPQLCPAATCNETAGCASLPSSTTTTTTVETLGTLRSTSSYPIRQSIDECGDICFPGSLPSGTSLTNCTITFTGTKAGIWYGVAVQVEDFTNSTSNVVLSSVPVQFLIYVQPPPGCPDAPVIFPLDRCLEVRIGVTINFNLSILNLCNASVSTVADIIILKSIDGMIDGNLTNSTKNSSILHLPFTWIPKASQIGSQELCVAAFTSENIQSTPYCVTFTVKNSTDLCVTTITSTTTTPTSTTSVMVTTTTILSSATVTTTTIKPLTITVTVVVPVQVVITVPTQNNSSLLGLALGLGIPLLLTLSGCICCALAGWRCRFFRNREIVETLVNYENNHQNVTSDLHDYRQEYIRPGQDDEISKDNIKTYHGEYITSEIDEEINQRLALIYAKRSVEGNPSRDASLTSVGYQTIGETNGITTTTSLFSTSMNSLTAVDVHNMPMNGTDSVLYRIYNQQQIKRND